jgi:hypothetical protein
MKTRPANLEIEPVESLIHLIRGQRVIVDADLARVYGVPTKRLNEAVRRNSDRFPSDFVFQLARNEAEEFRRSRSQNAALKRGQNICEEINGLMLQVATSKLADGETI